MYIIKKDNLVLCTTNDGLRIYFECPLRVSREHKILKFHSELDAAILAHRLNATIIDSKELYEQLDLQHLRE